MISRSCAIAAQRSTSVDNGLRKSARPACREARAAGCTRLRAPATYMVGDAPTPSGLLAELPAGPASAQALAASSQEKKPIVTRKPSPGRDTTSALPPSCSQQPPIECASPSPVRAVGRSTPRRPSSTTEIMAAPRLSSAYTFTRDASRVLARVRQGLPEHTPELDDRQPVQCVGRPQGQLDPVLADGVRVPDDPPQRGRGVSGPSPTTPSSR